nr:hypothetical protein [Desulfobacula sp.]
MKKVLIPLSIVTTLLLSCIFCLIPGHADNAPSIEPKNVIEKIKEKIQGVKYWENRLNKINESIIEQEAFIHGLKNPHEDSLYRETKEKIDEINREMEEFYIEHPDAAPTKTERNAKRLRDQADALIEKADRIEDIEFFEEILEDGKKEREGIKKKIGQLKAKKGGYVNKNQRTVIFLAIIVIVLMGLFPPVNNPVSFESNYSAHSGYRFISDIYFPPHDGKRSLLSINSTLLLVQWIGVVLVTIGGWVIFKTDPK